MKAIKQILVPTDFSECAKAALSQALVFASKLDAEIVVLHATSASEGPSPLGTSHIGREAQAPESAREAESEFDRALEDLCPTRKKLAKALVRGVTASSSILEYANENPPDLIILGTHGRRGFKRWLLGSVAEEIVRLAPCPVLSIKESARPGCLGEINDLLVPLDFSLASRTALKQAMDIGRAFASSLHLLHVIQPLKDEDLYGVSIMPPERYYNLVEAKAMGIMEKMAAEFQYPSKLSYHLAKGHPAHEIVKFAEERAMDMMIMAHLGLSRVPDRLFGSVTEYVVRAAPCPVWTADLDQE